LKTIYLHPFEESISELLPVLAPGIEDCFAAPVVAGRALPEPRHGYDSRRRQYHAHAFLDILAAERRYLPPAAAPEALLLGITRRDIFLPKLNFVFGVADRDRGTAIISLRRLDPEYYGKAPDPELLFERALKEAVHELGHLTGLDHCGKAVCIMHFYNTISDTDIKGPGFCVICRGKL
jgi:archaemetzincin